MMSDLPREILETAIKLRDPLKDVYLALYKLGPSSASDVAKDLGHARAYIHMRLNQLADIGIVKRKVKKRGRVEFETIGPAR
ncbi:MAG: helix-turn-helix domain-containing protein [Candidatus Bathyarchaeota archaeon]|nr:helix-turn-helix domain-containing protein [Candidatus Bathyarchaeota archaeon]